MVEKNEGNNLTANFSVTYGGQGPVQRSVFTFAVGIYIQLKMPFFVDVRGLKQIMTSPESGLGKTAAGIAGFRENFCPGWWD